MTIGYKRHFKDGSPTYFKEKIILGHAIYCASKTGLVPYTDGDLQPKIHTIREDNGGRWDMFEGMIHHVYGNRTKSRDMFLLNRFVCWQPIQIINTKIVGQTIQGKDVGIGHALHVIIGGRVMDDTTVGAIARNDGFPSTKAFFQWFNKDFSGKIIHWTSLRY